MRLRGGTVAGMGAQVHMAGEGCPQGDSHMMLFLSFRRAVVSSFGVCGVPRAVEALVESLSKASMSGDWGELSMRLATSAFWYCCRVTWAHRGMLTQLSWLCGHQDAPRNAGRDSPAQPSPAVP